VFNFDLGECCFFTKDTMCLVLYHRNADNPVIISSQKYDDAIASTLKWGLYHGLAFPTGITDTFFVAFNTEGLHRGVRPSSGPITGIRTSCTNPGPFTLQTHTDIRDYTIKDRAIWIATDGGVSRINDFGVMASTFSDNDSHWESINGYGLSNVEFLSIANSEFEPYSLVAMSPDGNSYVYKREITSPFDQKFNTGFGADGYRVRRTSYNPDSVLFTYNNYGTRDPSNFNSYGMADVNSPDYLHAPSFPKADGAPVDAQTNFSLKPFHFDKVGNFWTGTTDVFSSDNIYASTVTWATKSKTSSYWLTYPDNIDTTYSSISAFKQFTKPGATDTIISYFSLIEDESKTNDDTIKLVRAKYYIKLGSDVYESSNITPLLDEYPGPIHLVDTTNITDLIIDEANPDRLWVSFGFFKDKSENRILDYVQHADHPAKQGKIYYSADAGETWSDFSEGLPNYPVISMEYWQGSDDIIFAGTDVGIYIWNKDEAEWQCFDTGDQLPYCSVSDIEINYCTMKLRISTFGFGLWETPLPLGSIYSRTGAQPLEITTDETWTYTRDVGRDIVVKPGATLTIQNCEIRMPKDHRIVVERGAALVLDGATLINHCEPWMGVEVWGNSGKEHPLPGQVTGGFYPINLDDQGVVYLKNNSKIENAIVGIFAGRRTPEGYDAIYGGGIVIAENSHFINNQIGVQLLPYDFTEFIGGADWEDTDDDNISSFESCTFTTTNQYLIPSVPTAHLYLWDVDGIDILGSSFENERTTIDPLLYGIGIYSTDATFEVNRTFELLEPCTFTYLYRGIEVANTKPFIFIEPNIHHAQFQLNIRGLLCAAVQKISILENNFTTSVRDDIQTYGLYLEDCADYDVEENSFTTDAEFPSSLGTAPLTTGIFVANNSNAITEIYNNHFTWIEAGIRSQTVNARLQLKCNQFTTPINPFNIAVTSGGLADQGKCLGGAYTLEERMQAPAGNLFSTDASTDADIKVNNGIPVFKYRHHSDAPYLPVQYDAAKVTAQDCGLNGGEGDPCPSHLTGGGEESAAMMLAAAEGMATAMESLTDLGMAYGEGIDASGGEDAAWLSDLAWLEAEQNALIQDAVYAYVEEGKADSAKIILEQTDAFWAQQQLLQWYMLEKNVSAASTLLKQLPTDDQEQIDYATLASMQLNLIPDNRSWKELSEAEMLAVQSLAGKQSPAGVAAENILQLLTGTDYPEVFDIIDGAEELRMAQQGGLLSAISFYPNPANGQLHINLSAYPPTAELSIKAINIQGVEVWQVVTTAGSIYTCEVAQWPAGIYLFQVMDGNEVIGTEQVVVE
jgi:hypothetical protein